MMKTYHTRCHHHQSTLYILGGGEYGLNAADLDLFRGAIIERGRGGIVDHRI